MEEHLSSQKSLVELSILLNCKRTIGKAELPEILDTFSGECNSEVPFQFTKVLNYRNDKLEQARNQILEKDKKERKKESSLEVADPRANTAARKESVTSGANDPK